MSDKPGLPFSPFVEKNGFIYTSGQIPLVDGKLIEGNIKDQTHQVMKNMKAVLESAGVGFSNVIKTSIFMTDMGAYGDVNEVYMTYFEGSFPAREAIGVAKLPFGANIEISMVAAK